MSRIRYVYICTRKAPTRGQTPPPGASDAPFIGEIFSPVDLLAGLPDQCRCWGRIFTESVAFEEFGFAVQSVKILIFTIFFTCYWCWKNWWRGLKWSNMWILSLNCCPTASLYCCSQIGFVVESSSSIKFLTFNIGGEVFNLLILALE